MSTCCIFLFGVQLRQNLLSDWVGCGEHLGGHFTGEICFAENQKCSAQIHIRIFFLLAHGSCIHVEGNKTIVRVLIEFSGVKIFQVNMYCKRQTLRE